MSKYLTKKNVFISVFAILYMTVALVSLLHSFAFFGLANNRAMSILLGSCFEIGQMAVLFAILTSKRSKAMPWILMCILTLVQILGNVFSSYKYLINNANEDLRYFKEPIFVWTDLPDNITTVIITYIVGAILPIVALCMTAMVETFLEDEEDKPTNLETDENTSKTQEVEEPKVEQPKVQMITDAPMPSEQEEQIIVDSPSEEKVGEGITEQPNVAEQEETKKERKSGFVNL